MHDSFNEPLQIASVTVSQMCLDLKSFDLLAFLRNHLLDCIPFDNFWELEEVG